jgi:hypothetical protein
MKFLDFSGNIIHSFYFVDAFCPFINYLHAYIFEIKT